MIEDQINGYIDVIEHPRVFSWLENLAKTNPDLFYNLAKNNSFYFKRFFGNPLKSGLPEFPLCWNSVYKGLTFKILSNEKGTAVLTKTITTQEDFKKDAILGITIIKFLDELLNKITTGY